jgi:hypothetical protein
MTYDRAADKQARRLVFDIGVAPHTLPCRCSPSIFIVVFEFLLRQPLHRAVPARSIIDRVEIPCKQKTRATTKMFCSKDSFGRKKERKNVYERILR